MTMNYLPYPIHQNLLYGKLSDARRAGMDVYLARTSQAVFNLLALLTPSASVWRRHENDCPTVLAELEPKRNAHDNLFLMLNQLACAPVPNPALPSDFTIGEMALTVRPTELWKVLNKHAAELPFIKFSGVLQLAKAEGCPDKAEAWAQEV